MKIQNIKNRSVLFTFYNSPDWDLNLHLIMGDKYNYLVDSGLGSLSIEPIKKYIEKNNDKPVIVINTHYHWDHIWGNSSFKDSLIISHRLSREIILNQWEDMLKKNKDYCDGQVELCPPNLVFEKELYFTEDKVKIIYTPGHTVDSISVIDEKDKVINVGDNIGDTIDEIVPYIDCEKQVYRNSLLMYENMDFDRVVSGHNVVLGKDVIKKIISNL